MQRIEVATGEKYGDLTVVRETGKVTGKRNFICKCACGNQVTVRLGHLRSGHSTTCGNCGIEHDGQRKTVSEWASLYGLKESTLRARLKVMGISEALRRGYT